MSKKTKTKKNPLPEQKKKDYSGVVIACIIIFFAVVYFGVRAGIRMTDDKPEKERATVRLKFLRVQDGSMFYADHMDSSFHVGDMMSLDSSGRVLTFQTWFSQRVVVIGRYTEYKY